MMVDVAGHEGATCWDATKPDGTPRKIMDNVNPHGMGWQQTTDIRVGLKKMYAWFQQTGGQRG